MIYKDYAREFEKYKALKAEQLAARKLKQQQKPVIKETLVNCPYCKKLIAPKLKVCIYCHGKILTPMEQLVAKLFSKRNMIVLGVVALLAAAAVAAVVFKPYFVK